jgi:hypothetical protein
MQANSEGKQRRRWEWVLVALTAGAIVSTAVGHRQRVLVVEDASFVVFLALVVWFVVMAWWRLARAWRDQGAERWRVRTSLAGCIALSIAFAIPRIPFFFFFVLRWGFGPRWDYRALWLGFSVAALLAGVVAARGVRFPLICGAVLLGILALMIPAGV